MDPIEAKRKNAKRLIVFQGEDDPVAQVYVIRRVRSEDLQAQGFAEILGPSAVAAARDAAQRQRDAERLLAGASTEEDRVRIGAEIARMVEERNREIASTFEADEGRTRQLLARCEAYLLAAVVGIGIARDGVLAGIHPRGTASADICEELEPGKHIRPVTLVPGPDAGEGELPLSEIPITERFALGLLVMSALEVASAVQTFRGPAGAARAR